MVRLMERHGVEVVRKGKNNYYSPDLEQEIINKVLIEGQSQLTVSLDYTLTHQSNTHKLDSTIQEKQVYYC